MENTLIIITGLSASGKSTYAKTLLNENTKLVSSDSIRAELSHHQDQTQNEKVFRIFHKRIKEYLQQGFNVVADATNLTIKSRKQIIEIGKRANVIIESHIVVKDLQSCIEDDKNREFSVGEHVIQKQIRKFQIPFVEEGFDEIKIINHIKMNMIKNWTEFMSSLDNFVQHNKYHNTTIGKHQKLSYDYAHKNDFPIVIFIAIKYHDIGKFFTQTFDEQGNSHYYNHENYGAYIILCDFMYNAINMCDFKRDFLFYINYHMTIQNSCTTEKSTNKYKKLFGEEKYNNLMLMYEADKYREE